MDSEPSPGEARAEANNSRADFECNICLDTAQDAVVSVCGHLFCWACLHRWMETPRGNTCPVCKAGISADKVIPLYGRGQTTKDDPRQKLPPRPAGQRHEPENNNDGFFRGLENFHVSFGIGSFPFGFYGWGAGYHPHNPPDDPAQARQDAQLSQLFGMIGFLCLIWLMFGA